MRKVTIINFEEKEDFENFEKTNLDLKENEIAVWRVNIKKNVKVVEEKKYLLTKNELKIQERFLHSKDRLRFAVGRIFAKEIAAKYLKNKPEKIIMKKGKYSKPYITNTGGALNYNLSHSGDIVLLAFAYNANVGIDVEEIKYLKEYKELCEFFNVRERMKVVESEDFREFYRYWTAKEAYMKADGRGFGIDPKSFYITEDDILFDENEKEIEDFKIIRIRETEKYSETLAYCENKEKKMVVDSCFGGNL